MLVLYPSSLLYDDLAAHVLVDVTVILVGAGRIKLPGHALARRNVSQVPALAGGAHRVGDSVVVQPGDRLSGLDGDRTAEAELRDLHLSITSRHRCRARARPSRRLRRCPRRSHAR